MSSTDAGLAATIDFAIAAYRDEGEWAVITLPPRAATELGVLTHALGQLPSDVGTIGMVSVEEDFFIIARVSGTHVQLLLSDVGAATESPIAAEVVAHLALPMPDDDDQVQPAGDLGILADLGLSAMEMGAMCDDPDLYPDELLEDIAQQIGFGQDFKTIVDAVLA